MDERDERLEALIAEQQADMDRGGFQYPEPGVESYDRFVEGGSDPEFAMRIGHDRQTRAHPECAYHGRGHLRQQDGTFYGYACRACEDEAGRKYRSKPAVREKLSKRTKRWKDENRERYNAYQREYKKRRYDNDPEFRAKEQARARARKEAMKHAEVQGPKV